MTSASLVSDKRPIESPLTTVPQDAGAPLPVLGMLNNVITITNYINAIQAAALPSSITGDPQHATLVTGYADWQYGIWEEYFEGLVNGNMLAQAEELNELVRLGVDQSSFSSVVSPSPAPTPTVVSSCDDVANLITSGTTYVSQLLTIAQGIQGADQDKLNALEAIVTTLNTQFGKLEDQLTDKAIDNTKEAVVTFINVSVAVGTEKDPVGPLVKGVAQVGTDIVNELILSADINSTLAQLEAAWLALDEETLQLAQINQIVNRLNQVVTQTSAAISALNNIVNDWQTVCDVINGSPASWLNSGLSQVAEWSNRMCNVTFVCVPIQTVSSVS